MKRLIAAITIMMFFLLPHPSSFAKSYTIDQVQIRGMVYPDGSILMNEIFTYTVDGNFSEFTRTFPNKHHHQITEFEAYVIQNENPVAGEITREMLQQLYVTESGTSHSVSVQAKDQRISIFYMYLMKDVIKSHELYSDMDITFFEKGSKHKVDMNEVSIEYVFPSEIGSDKIHGFIHDRHARPPEVYSNAITFSSLTSEANSETSTRVLFPSHIMTHQKKSKATEPLDKVLATEEKRVNKTNTWLSLIPTVKVVALIVGIVFLVLSALVLLILRQRWLPLGGNIDHVLRMDPLYLFFIDRNAKYHPKSFLAELFSLNEKGFTKVMIEPGDIRLADAPDYQDRTLSFHLTKRKDGLLSFEKKLVSWLFKEQKFNLHEIAGATIKEKNNSTSLKEYERKQYDFESNHWNWHEDVKGLMIDAGTFSDKISKNIRWTILILLSAMTLFGLLVDIQSGWEIAKPLIISIVIFYYILRGIGKALIPTILFFGFMLASSFQIVDDALSGALVFLTCMSAVLYYAMPASIIVSINGFRTKRSILKFRNQIVRGIPEHLTNEDQERWLTRAYLLNSSKENLPRLRGSQLDSLPLVKLFATGKDPLYFVMKTWGPQTYPIKRSKD